ncbi:MAG: D-lyxose/D-mannose family sugar isomerase [Chloroflexi bacterium]|nr:D-lyxose/D-mannose family sugar isomerase [Chloroflexota bacterium]
MKRSEINAILHDADAFVERCQFRLPPFAHWGPQDWTRRGAEVSEIVARRLGWDITDFGSGDFRRRGLCLFTLRNGSPENLKAMRGKTYAEKILLVDVDQETPFHFHWAKTEDIINRGGGKLLLQLHNATPNEALADTPVTVSVDGIRRTVEAGGVITLAPGESITFVDHLYHRFWAAEGKVLAGEVSTVNDDAADNRFLESIGRFPVIEEDEPPLYLLCNDYGRYYRAG